MLAIHGGEPEISAAMPAWPPEDERIVASVMACMSDGSWGKYDASPTQELMNRLSQRFCCEHVQLCSSGTIAVELALRGAGVNADSEVIMAGYDFPGNFRAIESIGAFPVLVDVVEGGWTLDVEQLHSAVTETTSAVIVSHLHGQIADIGRLRQVVSEMNDDREQSIAIIEDACQVPGGAVSGHPLGSLGDVGVFSFGGSKLLSAGRGGAIVTRSPEILQRIRIFNSRGNEAFPLSQLQAAALIPQLEMLDELTASRQQAANVLIEATRTIDLLGELNQLVEDVATLTPAYYKLPWLLLDEPTGWSRVDFIAAAQAEGVPIDVGFRGFLRRTPKRCRKVGTLANCQVAAHQTMLLHHPMLLADRPTLDRVAIALNKVARANP